MTTPHYQHATCVAFDDNAVLIMGASGSGKSALGLHLMGFGCKLVSDDQVILESTNNKIIATAPATISNMIEARGIGILNAVSRPTATIVLVVDLNKTEIDRLPIRRQITLLGCTIPLIYKYKGAHFAAAILQILKAGWRDV